MSAFSTTERGYIDPFLFISCPPDNKAPHFLFHAGGPTVGGAESKSLLLFFIDELPSEGLRFESHTNTEPEWLSFGFAATAGIIDFLQKADHDNRQVRLAALIAADDVVLVDFDVTGLTTNYQRLACS